MEEGKRGGWLKALAVGMLLVMLGFCLGSLFQSARDAGRGTFPESGGTASTKDTFDLEAINEKIQLLNMEIGTYYLEEIDYRELENGIYKGLLSGLDDPYSEYYTSEEYGQIMESASGSYCGIGATLSQNQEDGSCTIVGIFKQSPAEEAGLQLQDVIYKVEGMEVTGMDLSQIVSHVKGEENTQVKLTILRDGKELEVTLTRKTIEIETVAYEMLEDNIGYIALSEFDEVSAKQFHDALTALKEQGMKGLVVDLRNNPGGILDVVVEILDDLLPEGLLVYTEDKYGNRQEYTSDAEQVTDVPMAVLVNGYSASASEIFAGAMKDYGRAVLVGTTTYGKGIVQRIISLGDGSALKLTIAKYYTPKGNNIHGKGIAPDVEVEPEKAAATGSAVEQVQDNQLQEALKVLKK